ncbi:hypothetical protein Y695_01274 [Hydrogenophaga sp. T4]|nr:hypothetical protein Y695_01274 [Hydrogenophaga sp. T4]
MRDAEFGNATLHPDFLESLRQIKDETADWLCVPMYAGISALALGRATGHPFAIDPDVQRHLAAEVGHPAEHGASADALDSADGPTGQFDLEIRLENGLGLLITRAEAVTLSIHQASR